MAYTSLTEVRLLTNLTTGDISDSDITNLVPQATYQLNADVNKREIREKIEYIDKTRENNINSSNTTYYVKNWKGKFIGDFDNDGDVDTSDITVYQVASDGTETELTVSSITPDGGKFVLSSAPSSGVNLYVTYCWSYEDEETPSKLIELACTNLTAALCFEKINRGLSPLQVFGNIRLTRDMNAGNVFFREYRNIVDKINAGNQIHYTEAKIF